MDNIRFVLVSAMLMISYMLWESWQIDYGPKPPALISDKPSVAGNPGELSLSPANTNNNAQAANPASVSAVPAENLVTVTTDVLKLEIETKGGTIRTLDLLQYPHEKENTIVNQAYALVGMNPPEKNLSPIRLFDNAPESLFLAQSGLVASDNSAAAPDHYAIFNAEQPHYALSEGENSLSIPLTWKNAQGLSVTKLITVSRGSYAIQVEHKVTNDSDKTWSGRQYDQLVRIKHSDGGGNNFIRTYSGGVVYTDKDKYKKISFDELGNNLNVSSTGGWSAMIQHYFASAWIPAADQENHFYSKALNDNRYVIGSYSPDTAIEPHSSGRFSAQLYAGPKIQPVLEALAPGLELTVDYSWLTIIAKPIYWLLNQYHSYLGNWGVAILCVTLTIKLLFFNLSKASFKSMAKMRKIQPRLKELQERYGEDRQKFNIEMMAMYKREKVNPLGGCLPIMVQIPVFISLYWVLIETVELRQADFALWIQDLSAQDPFYLLPIVYGITMKIQQSLNPAPIDPLQAQVMKMFPKEASLVQSLIKI